MINPKQIQMTMELSFPLSESVFLLLQKVKPFREAATHYDKRQFTYWLLFIIAKAIILEKILKNR